MTKGDSQNEQEYLSSGLQVAHIEGQTDIFEQLDSPEEAKPPASKKALTVQQVVAIRLKQKGNQ